MTPGPRGGGSLISSRVAGVSAKAKRFEYAGSVARDGGIVAEDGAPVALPPEWTPEHLLLAAVARCTLKSLAYHARGALAGGEGRMRGAVTKRDSDGLFGMVELEVELEVEFDPEPAAAELAELLARAERDCFVGNSLSVRPQYRWRVNGNEVSSRSP